MRASRVRPSAVETGTFAFAALVLADKETEESCGIPVSDREILPVAERTAVTADRTLDRPGSLQLPSKNRDWRTACLTIEDNDRDIFPGYFLEFEFHGTVDV